MPLIPDNDDACPLLGLLLDICTASCRSMRGRFYVQIVPEKQSKLTMTQQPLSVKKVFNLQHNGKADKAKKHVHCQKSRTSHSCQCSKIANTYIAPPDCLIMSSFSLHPHHKSQSPVAEQPGSNESSFQRPLISSHPTHNTNHINQSPLWGPISISAISIWIILRLKSVPSAR